MPLCAPAILCLSVSFHSSNKHALGVVPQVWNIPVVLHVLMKRYLLSIKACESHRISRSKVLNKAELDGKSRFEQFLYQEINSSRVEPPLPSVHVISELEQDSIAAQQVQANNERDQD